VMDKITARARQSTKPMLCKKHKVPKLRTKSGKLYCRKCQAEYSKRYYHRLAREIEMARCEQIWKRHQDPDYDRGLVRRQQRGPLAGG
jgi:uncharacterized Zn finger protein (UPF0148 family)